MNLRENYKRLFKQDISEDKLSVKPKEKKQLTVEQKEKWQSVIRTFDVQYRGNYLRLVGENIHVNSEKVGKLSEVINGSKNAILQKLREAVVKSQR